jgi:hypothetical protein
MKKIVYINTAVTGWSMATIVIVSGLFARGFIYYLHDDVGRACFWMLAGIACDTVMTWISGVLQGIASKQFADYVQGVDKKDSV